MGTSEITCCNILLGCSTRAHMPPSTLADGPALPLIKGLVRWCLVETLF